MYNGDCMEKLMAVFDAGPFIHLSEVRQLDLFSLFHRILTTHEVAEELKGLKAGTEMYVPVSGGVFMRAAVKEPDKLLVNVGANTAVTKTVPETIKLIQDQINEIGSAKTQLGEQVQLILLDPVFHVATGAINLLVNNLLLYWHFLNSRLLARLAGK